jgi:hypothetical protein
MKTAKVIALAMLLALQTGVLRAEAAKTREIPLVVTDTLGNPIRHFFVTIRTKDRPSGRLYQSPRSLALPEGNVTIRVSASLHRPVEESVEVSAALEVITIALVQPDASQISGEGSPANPSVEVSVGPLPPGPDPVVLRVISVYSSWTRNFLLRRGDTKTVLDDLPFGEYRAFLVIGGRVTREFELVNAVELEPSLFRAVSASCP